MTSSFGVQPKLVSMPHQRFEPFPKKPVQKATPKNYQRFKNWTDDEHAKFLKLCAENIHLTANSLFNKLSAEIPGRSYSVCKRRYYELRKINQVPWIERSLQKLVDALHTHQVNHLEPIWENTSLQLQATPDQCRIQWNALVKRVSYPYWTPQHDVLLQLALQTWPGQFHAISKKTFSNQKSSFECLIRTVYLRFQTESKPILLPGFSLLEERDELSFS